jgi:hypothetical protein
MWVISELYPNYIRIISVLFYNLTKKNNTTANNIAFLLKGRGLSCEVYR